MVYFRFLLRYLGVVFIVKCCQPSSTVVGATETVVVIGQDWLIL